MAMLRSGRTRGRQVVSRVHAIDLQVDRWVERIRGPMLDPVFYGASSAADHGLLWLAVGAGRAAAVGDPGVAVRLALALGVESLVTNGPIKMCFRRVRPEDDRPPDGPLPYGMHRPISSSFPSGHAASAFTAAMLLRDSPAAPLWFGLAAVVAGSRVYTRMHHASDVVAGAALGIALGALARRIVPL
ncbi:MAG: phosphatase PAP2 family protein [Acidimicrobiia bacterium]